LGMGPTPKPPIPNPHLYIINIIKKLTFLFSLEIFIIFVK
jgi:hypothetical protein